MSVREYRRSGKPVTGEISVPGDKSISHRAAIFGAMAEGVTVIDGFLTGEDCLHTLSCLRQLGVEIEREGDRVLVHGRGYEALKEPADVLDVGNSGTTMRLLTGLVAARPFYSVLSGDRSLNSRPMDRVARPLSQMGAKFYGRAGGKYAPLTVIGSRLQPIRYMSPVASAQVKSALLLAGLQTEGVTEVVEPAPSRDHTERMIQAFGGRVETDGRHHRVIGPQRLTATRIKVPGDPSSAAFFIALAALTPGSRLVIRNVCINPTRAGFIEALKRMGADIRTGNKREVGGEPVTDLDVRYAPLSATEIAGEIVPSMIDEIPVFALVAARAQGRTVIRDAGELKVKETNRIKTVVGELKKLGVRIEETADGMIIDGESDRLMTGGEVDAHGDHRLAMMLAVASQACEDPVLVHGADAVSVSFPGFSELFASLTQK